MSDIFTPEQEAELKRRADALRADLDAKYTAKAHAFRDWITAHPLPAARVIGGTCAITFTLLGWKCAPLLNKLAGLAG